MGHKEILDTTIYLHLSRKHLKTVANPLDELPVSPSPAVSSNGRIKRAKK